MIEKVLLIKVMKLIITEHMMDSHTSKSIETLHSGPKTANQANLLIQPEDQNSRSPTGRREPPRRAPAVRPSTAATAGPPHCCTAARSVTLHLRQSPSTPGPGGRQPSARSPPSPPLRRPGCLD